MCICDVIFSQQDLVEQLKQKDNALSGLNNDNAGERSVPLITLCYTLMSTRVIFSWMFISWTELVNLLKSKDKDLLNLKDVNAGEIIFISDY